MPDQKFFDRSGPFTLSVIAEKIGAELSNPISGDYVIENIAPLDQAGASDISFLDNKKYRQQFSDTKAGACIIHPSMQEFAPANTHLLLSSNAYKSFALASQLFYPVNLPEASISDRASIHPTARIGANCHIGDFAVIGANAVLGDYCWIEPHAVVNASVQLGSYVRIGINATVSHAIIGDHVRLYPGVRIGQDGFGFAIDPKGFIKVPQLGRVIIEGHSEIGANTCIDRGSMGDTVIGMGTWIDNLVQIGHNVKIGKGCVIVSQVGISGSTELGDYVVLAGQVGIAGHLKIGSGARIAAQAGVLKDVEPKEEMMGYPAVPLKKFMRQSVMLNKLISERRAKGTP